VGEQVASYFRIADVPDHAIREVVMDVDDHQHQNRRRSSWILTEHVSDDAHRARRHDERDENTDRQ